MSEGAGWADAPGFCRCARSIENFCRIKMVVARASGMDLASILKRNTFLTLGVRPAGGPVVRAGRGDTGGPGGCAPGRPGGTGYRWASAIDLICRIKMVVARASGTVRAWSLKQNKFWDKKLPKQG